jgi:hypothetical protein
MLINGWIADTSNSQFCIFPRVIGQREGRVGGERERTNFIEKFGRYASFKGAKR